jgi:hypothetical protein
MLNVAQNTHYEHYYKFQFNNKYSIYIFCNINKRILPTYLYMCYTTFLLNTSVVLRFPHKTMFVGGLVPLFRYLSLFAYSGVKHILCCVFVTTITIFHSSNNAHYVSLVLLCISLYGLLLLYGNLRTVFICHMFSQINVREYRRSNQQWTIQRNCSIGYTRGRKTKRVRDSDHCLTSKR